MDHEPITPEQLARYALGDLDKAATKIVSTHLDSSPESRQLFDRILIALETLTTDDSSTAPREAVDRAKGLHADARAGSIGQAIGRVADRVWVVIAGLVFDSAAGPALAGFRGATGTRHLTFACDQAEIDLEFHPPERAGALLWRVRGQVSAFGETPVRRVRWGAAAGASEKLGQMEDLATGPNGGFKVECAPGTFDLEVWVGDSNVRVPGLQIPGAGAGGASE